MSEERKGYMSAESKKYIDEISADIKSDADKYGTKSRFGYFSIPHSSFLGDRFYSQNKEKVYRTEDRKVITEPRGIFTKPLKRGNGPDVYFINGFKEEKETLKKLEEIAKKEREDLLRKVKGRKKGGEESNNNNTFKANFKPSGPQEYKDLYDKNPVNYKVPITKEIDKKTKIDKEHKTVFTEKRGIMTNPPKKGSSSVPGVLFSYFKEDKKLLEAKEKNYRRGKSQSQICPRERR